MLLVGCIQLGMSVLLTVMLVRLLAVMLFLVVTLFELGVLRSILLMFLGTERLVFMMMLLGKFGSACGGDVRGGLLSHRQIPHFTQLTGGVGVSVMVLLVSVMVLLGGVLALTMLQFMGGVMVHIQMLLGMFLHFTEQFSTVVQFFVVFLVSLLSLLLLGLLHFLALLFTFFRVLLRFLSSQRRLIRIFLRIFC